MPRTPTDEELLTEEVYRLVNRSRRLLMLATARCLEARGETIFTWQVVCYLSRNGPTSQKDLAYANAQHPAGISRLVEELEEQGLVTRAPDPADRRRLLVQVTPHGRAWLDKLMPEVIGAVNDAMHALSHKKREALRELLTELLGEAG
jgi:DNA-binding MarR family transcriptional regulator